MDEPTPNTKPRFRPYFGLSQLLILTAGLAIGMGAMQPWRTWEPDPTEVNYDVKVVRVKKPVNLTAAENIKLLTDLANDYTPDQTGLEREAVSTELLGATTLTAMTKSDATFELANASPGEGADKLDSVQVKLRPYKADTTIDSIIEARLFWKPTDSAQGKTMQGISRPVSTQPGATEIVEIELNSKSPTKNPGERYFVVVTPSVPSIFNWVASSPGAKPVLQKKK